MNVTWNYDVDGAGNNILTNISGDTDHAMTVALDGDDNDWDFIQQGGKDYELTIDWEGDDSDVDITQGSSSNSGNYQKTVIAWDGDDADLDILQQSGNCPSGITSCYGVVDLDITSNDSIINIKQKDTSD